MNVLVVGKGGREHAMAWKIAQSPRVEQLYAAPGSTGMARHAQCVDIAMDDFEGLSAFAQKHDIGLTVVGPENVLSQGIVDHFEAKGLKIFGPTAAAARIESSKAFSKELMQRIGVPTARHRTFTDSAQALAYLQEQGAPIVVKASGLASGKGAIVAHTEEEARLAVTSIMEESIFGDSGSEVVIEEFMEGEEASLFALTDGQAFVTLVTAQDHKAIYEGDKGPNTGGMGAYSPAPVMTPELIRTAEEHIIRPVLEEMRRLGCPFRGVLYCGLMLTEEGPKVVEFNCRFGDPEAQVVLPLLKTDLVDVLEAACDGQLDQIEIENDARAAVGVVLASGGYPDANAYETGKVINGVEELEDIDDLEVFHADTIRENGQLCTAGGRVLCVTALAGDISAAVDRVYQAVDQVDFDKVYYRRDIAHRALARLA